MRLPFVEIGSGSKRIRTFAADTDPEELVWHRDDEDRQVHVLEGEGWFFQRDGELPVPLRHGDTLHIPRHEWHRVLTKKSTKLVVEITVPNS